MSTEHVLIDGNWRAANSSDSFHAFDPSSGEPLPEQYPVSGWADCDEALDSAVVAFEALQLMPR